ncbi:MULTISPECIES: isochorismatase family protein [Streptomyces]|uniref:nicotinamidase n=3 Tax=Streptomyces TaxID=1883 RepID=A0A6G3SMC3_STRAQ|nr:MULTISPECIES: isochorismatase family protein [Streptomyces]NEB83578.1 isochorismatase family protein [Streptomyces anulatus]NEB97301.1 isochorismatase family protein [Streptomyces anulatus]NED26886.1 isochorismatase family protein [Streptomyces anulatus]OLO29230.1 nicotinamidase [Streptomyces sp. MNU77]OWA26378.1 nicotinamidase [Streptomyces sp. CS057]
MGRGLIVVDVQNDFCEGGSVPVSGGARIATKIADLVERSAGRDYEYVVATRDHHIDPGSHFSEHPDFKDSFPVHCVAGGEGGEFHPHFAPAVTGGKVDAVFFKGAHSASKSGFEGADEQGTALADWLRARGVEQVDVVGIATDHCVRATALDAVKAGFRAHVRLDYSVGVAPDTIDSTLDDFRAAGIAVSGETPVPR